MNAAGGVALAIETQQMPLLLLPGAFFERIASVFASQVAIMSSVHGSENALNVSSALKIEMSRNGSVDCATAFAKTGQGCALSKVEFVPPAQGVKALGQNTLESSESESSRSSCTAKSNRCQEGSVIVAEEKGYAGYCHCATVVARKGG